MIRALAAAAVVVFLAFVGEFWHPVYGFTSFILLDKPDDHAQIEAFKSIPVFRSRSGGYDGQFYAQLAYHPTLTSPELIRVLDSPPYRARRILAPALAWLFSAGQPGWIVHAYSVLNVAAWLVLAAILWRLLQVEDGRGLVAWAGVLFSTGAISSVRLALTDLVALTVLAAGMLLRDRERDGAGTALVAAASLARETSLVAAVGLLRRPWPSMRNGRRVLLAAAPLAAWLLYIRWVLGPSDPRFSAFAFPLAGLGIKAAADIRAVLSGHGDHVLAVTTILATIGMVAQGAFFAVRPRLDDAWWRIGAAYALMMTLLGPVVWEGLPGAETRVLLPLTMAFNVAAARRRAALAWLLVANLPVLGGILLMRDAPHDLRELGAARIEGVGVLASANDGWLSIDHTWRRSMARSGADSTIDLETWPKVTRSLTIEVTVRSEITPFLLGISQDGASVWRETVFPKPQTIRFPCLIRDGHARLELTANVAGVRDAPSPGDRPAIFAVENLQLAP